MRQKKCTNVTQVEITGNALGLIKYVDVGANVSTTLETKSVAKRVNGITHMAWWEQPHQSHAFSSSSFRLILLSAPGPLILILPTVI